jgi:hypothetical protein
VEVSELTSEGKVKISAIAQPLCLHGDECAARVKGALACVQQCQHIRESLFILAEGE